MVDQIAKSALLETIRKALEGLRFGKVEISVHDSKVVLIERIERLRVSDEPRKGGR